MRARGNILEKIRKLFALANGAGSEAEAECAMRNARRLMDRYRLSASEVEKDSELSGFMQGCVAETRAIPEWEKALTGVMTNLCLVEVLLDRGQGVSHLRYVGELAEIALACSMHRYLREVVRRAARRHARPGVRRASFTHGMVQRLIDRSAAIRQEREPEITEQQADSLALMRADAKDRIRRLLVEHTRGAVHRIRPPREGDPHSFVAGVMAAECVDLGVRNRLSPGLFGEEAPVKQRL